ncbi:hypothetical protein SO694_0005026 [Aureococcus anophagefferens]|uniref:Uncharacterized protein n=1 Tax=Aureococcus anophagefferens TaxID=44056 RepID=A0ABR1FYN0_AURAN
MLRGFVAAACVRAASASWPKSPHAARRAAITGEGRELPPRAAHPGAQPHRGQPHRRRLQGEIVTCDPGDVYVVADDDDIEGGSHPGSMGNPLVVVSGCPVTVEVAQGKHAFLAIPGFSEASATGALPQLKWEWSLHGVPALRGPAPEAYFDWYYWPLLNVDDVSFVEHDENFDYYHCYGYCQYDSGDGVEDKCLDPPIGGCDAETDLREVFDVLWVGISTFANKEAMRVTYRPTLFLEESALDGGDLAYISENGDARGERDSRAKPYCDWWPDMTLDDLDGVDDCTEIPGAVCDSDGRIFAAGRNFLEGAIPDCFFRSPALQLYELDLGWNELSGPVPHVPNPMLRLVDLSHNRFTGTIDAQFDDFAAGQDHGVTSALLLDDNEFCGPLPTVFYDLVEDSHYFVYELDASRNRFRCAPSGANEYFEAWAHTPRRDFGKCTPVAVPAAVAPGRGDPVVMPGNDVDVRGTFVATTDGKCEFALAVGRHSRRAARDVELTADKSADLSDVALVPKASPTEGDILL